jgi:Putative Flp pilus-assembly TadE/G-like
VTGDGGTMIPLIVLCFLVAGLLGCASIAASAAFLAQRELAGACDGAAIAAANAVSRAALGTVRPPGPPPLGRDGGGEGDVLPLDADSVQRAVAAYQGNLGTLGSPTWMTASTDGRVVTVVCRRTVRIPFGWLLGYPDGLDRTATAHARSPLT